MSIFRFSATSIRAALVHGSFLDRKQAPTQRSTRLEVFQLEDRALLSTTPGSTHGGFLAVNARVKDSQSAVQADSPLRDAAKPLPAIPPIGAWVTT